MFSSRVETPKIGWHFPTDCREASPPHTAHFVLYKMETVPTPQGCCEGQVGWHVPSSQHNAGLWDASRNMRIPHVTALGFLSMPSPPQAGAVGLQLTVWYFLGQEISVDWTCRWSRRWEAFFKLSLLYGVRSCHLSVPDSLFRLYLLLRQL